MRNGNFLSLEQPERSFIECEDRGHRCENCDSLIPDNEDEIYCPACQEADRLDQIAERGDAMTYGLTVYHLDLIQELESVMQEMKELKQQLTYDLTRWRIQSIIDRFGSITDQCRKEIEEDDKSQAHDQADGLRKIAEAHQ